MFASSIPSPSPTPLCSQPDSVWVLLTDATGDNNQCLALAEALEASFKLIRLDWIASDPAYDRSISKRLLADGPAAQEKRDALGLHAPWPKIVIGCGRRADRVGFWIKAQSDGKTKYIGSGRASGRLDQYDLLVGTPQFALPSRPNIVPLRMPLVPSRKRKALQRPIPGTADGEVIDLVPASKPWFSILLGGSVKEFETSEQTLTSLARCAQAAADHFDGTVVVSSSRRTPAEALAVVERALDRRAYIYRWSTAGSGRNPYATLLEQSSALFVTGDSASMIAEACSSGTPTYIVEYPERRDFRGRWRRKLFLGFRTVIASLEVRSLPRLARRIDLAQEWLHNAKILRYPRDVRRLHASAYDMGLARPLIAFDPKTMPLRDDDRCVLSTRDDLHHLVARCHALLRDR